MKKMNKWIAVLLAALVCSFAGTEARAGLVDGNLQARIKGMVSGNWEIGLGDQVGVPGLTPPGFVQTTGPDPFVGINNYSFLLESHASTGLATFQVAGEGFTSTLLTSPDYGIGGYGFRGITLGIIDGDTHGGSASPTSLTVGNLVLNGSSLSGSYSGGGMQTYFTHTLYSGMSLADIVLQGTFVFAGDYAQLNERTKFDLNLTEVTPVPLPGSLLLLGSGLIGIADMRRRNTAG